MMYPESLKIDFHNDRDEVLELLRNNINNPNPNETNLNSTFLVSFPKFILFIFFTLKF